jgi:hypothetical protein
MQANELVDDLAKAVTILINSTGHPAINIHNSQVHSPSSLGLMAN